MGPMVTQDFTEPKLASYLSMKVLTFAENENMRFINYHTKLHSDLQLRSLV